jgi:hypothetical protein
MSNDYCFQDEQSFILYPMITIFSYAFSLTRGVLLQTKSAGLQSFVVSLQASNQFSKP